MEPEAESPSVMKSVVAALRLRCLAFAEVKAAVAELAVVQVGFFGALVGQLFHAGHVLALPLALLDALAQSVGHVRVFVQVVVEVLFHESPR